MAALSELVARGFGDGDTRPDTLSEALSLEVSCRLTLARVENCLSVAHQTVNNIATAAETRDQVETPQVHCGL